MARPKENPLSETERQELDRLRADNEQLRQARDNAAGSVQEARELRRQNDQLRRQVAEQAGEDLAVDGAAIESPPLPKPVPRAPAPAAGSGRNLWEGWIEMRTEKNGFVKDPTIPVLRFRSNTEHRAEAAQEFLTLFGMQTEGRVKVRMIEEPAAAPAPEPEPALA